MKTDIETVKKKMQLEIDKVAYYLKASYFDDFVELSSKASKD